MICRTSFTAFGQRHHLTLDTENIDRDFADENYAYWIVESKGHYFEVNIWKDDFGNYTNQGAVYGYEDYGYFEDDTMEESYDVSFEMQIDHRMSACQVQPDCGLWY